MIVGRYETESGKWWWTKRYLGKQNVAYQGYNEGKGIWGGWEIPLENRRLPHLARRNGNPDTGKLTEAIEEPELLKVASSLEDAFSPNKEYPT